MQVVKRYTRLIIGEKLFFKMSLFKKRLILWENFQKDYILYSKHSNVFQKDTLEKLEALVILRYHSIEKGLLNKNIRFRFGKEVVIELLSLLKNEEVLSAAHKTQFKAGYIALREYYDIHFRNSVDISDYFSIEDYQLVKQLADPKSISVKNHDILSYFNNSEKDFFHFSNSRCSVRDFTSEKVPFPVIKKVIALAKNAPSVCNRQPVKVYYLEDKWKIQEVFNIQQGLRGYSEEISQLLVVVSNRSFFYTIEERNQLYIDGGIFLMNLLYSLHYYKIASCPAHWALNKDADNRVKELLKLKDSEKVISLVAIGKPKETFKTALSMRRATEEVLQQVL